MSLLSDFTAAVDLLLQDGEKYNAIVNGPASGPTSLVTTDSGDVKTFARAIAEAEDAVDAVLVGGSSAILTLLGVPTYANLTAANAALAIGVPYYDTALSKLQITTA